MLPDNSSIPVCVKNKCGQGKVSFNSECHPLNSEDGCKHFTAYIGRKVVSLLNHSSALQTFNTNLFKLLVADPTTLKLSCADEENRYACVKTCCTGSKREYRNICKNGRLNSS